MRGHSLAELTVALFLVAFIGALVSSLLGGATRAVTGLVERSEVAETRRTVAALLHEELSVGVQGRDWSLDGERAIRLRAFRGYARVCGPGAEPGSWRVAWRGDRAPDPARDSLLVLGHQGRWVAVQLSQVGAAPAHPGAAECLAGPGERVADWRGSGWGRSDGWDPGADPLDPGPGSDPAGAGAGAGAGGGASPGAPQRPLLARYFESGRYSLEDGAFRYRRGSGARQPLTPEVVEGESGFVSLDRGIEVELFLRLGPGRAPGGPSGPGRTMADRWPVYGDGTP